MESKELIKILNGYFKDLGCFKAQKNSWILEMPEIAIVFKIRTSSWSRHLYIDTGIIFKKLIEDGDLKTANVDKGHIGHGLYNILLTVFNEKQDYLEKLFSFESAEASANISVIFELLKSKVIPHLENFNDYKYLVANFDKNIAFKPFFVYRELPEFYIDFFKKQIKA